MKTHSRRAALARRWCRENLTADPDEPSSRRAVAPQNMRCTRHHELLRMDRAQLLRRFDRTVAHVEEAIEFIAADVLAQLCEYCHLFLLPRLPGKTLASLAGRQTHVAKNPKAGQHPRHFIRQQPAANLVRRVDKAEVRIKSGGCLAALAEERLRPAPRSCHHDDMREQVLGLVCGEKSVVHADTLAKSSSPRRGPVDSPPLTTLL